MLKNIAQIIKDKKKDRGLSSTDLSKRTGLSLNQISLIESCKRRPAVKHLRTILAELDVPSSERDLLIHDYEVFLEDMKNDMDYHAYLLDQQFSVSTFINSIKKNDDIGDLQKKFYGENHKDQAAWGLKFRKDGYLYFMSLNFAGYNLFTEDKLKFGRRTYGDGNYGEVENLSLKEFFEKSGLSKKDIKALYEYNLNTLRRSHRFNMLSDTVPISDGALNLSSELLKNDDFRDLQLKKIRSTLQNMTKEEVMYKAYETGIDSLMNDVFVAKQQLKTHMTYELGVIPMIKETLDKFFS